MPLGCSCVCGQTRGGWWWYRTASVCLSVGAKPQRCSASKAPAASSSLWPNRYVYLNE